MFLSLYLFGRTFKNYRLTTRLTFHWIVQSYCTVCSLSPRIALFFPPLYTHLFSYVRHRPSPIPHGYCIRYPTPSPQYHLSCIPATSRDHHACRTPSLLLPPPMPYILLTALFVIPRRGLTWKFPYWASHTHRGWFSNGKSFLYPARLKRLLSVKTCYHSLRHLL